VFIYNSTLSKHHPHHRTDHKHDPHHHTDHQLLQVKMVDVQAPVHRSLLTVDGKRCALMQTLLARAVNSARLLVVAVVLLQAVVATLLANQLVEVMLVMHHARSPSPTME